MAANRLRILVADDNEGLRDLYSHWLAGDHDVETAEDGAQALDTLGEATDVVFLDRDMPGPAGTTVAREIAASEFDPHVVMVSSLAPDFDIVEMPIDGYLQKPVQESDLRSALDRYERLQSYMSALDDFFALTSKLATIEARKSQSERRESEEYERLKDRTERKRAELDAALGMADADWQAAFQSCLGDERGADRPNV